MKVDANTRMSCAFVTNELTMTIQLSRILRQPNGDSSVKNSCPNEPIETRNTLVRHACVSIPLVVIVMSYTASSAIDLRLQHSNCELIILKDTSNKYSSTQHLSLLRSNGNSRTSSQAALMISSLGSLCF
jgi:hypothetical protein